MARDGAAVDMVTAQNAVCSWSFASPATSGAVKLLSTSNRYPLVDSQCYAPGNGVVVDAMKTDGSFYHFEMNTKGIAAGSAVAIERGAVLYRLVASQKVDPLGSVQTLCFTWNGMLAVSTDGKQVTIDATCTNEISDMGVGGFASTIGQTPSDVVLHGVITLTEPIPYK